MNLNINALLSLEQKIRSSSNLNELGFSVTNDFNNFLKLKQAFFFVSFNNRLKLRTISGLNAVERNTPFAIWTEALCGYLADTYSAKSVLLTKSDVTDQLKSGWEEWMPEQIVYVPVRDPNTKNNSAIILSCEEPPDESLLGLLDYLSSVVGYSVWALKNKRNPLLKIADGFTITRKKFFAGIAVLLIIMFLPVRQSVISPAETAPLSYTIITAPIEGVIKNILVKPSETVSEGQILFRYDETTLRNRLEILTKSYGVTKTEALLSEQKAFSDAQSKGEVSTQKARVKEKVSEISYVSDLLRKLEVRATKNGVVIFNEASDWEGKPVATGEKIMLLADQKDVGVLVWLPVSDAISLEKGAKIRLFLNLDPVNPLDAVMTQSSYQSFISPGGIASYRILGRFTGDNKNVRIGLRGSAKLYSERIPLWYYLFRKPIASFRGFFGI